MLCLQLAMLARCLSFLLIGCCLLGFNEVVILYGRLFPPLKIFLGCCFFLPSIRKRFGLVRHSCEITTQKCYVALPRFIYFYIFEWWEQVSIL